MNGEGGEVNEQTGTRHKTCVPRHKVVGVAACPRSPSLVEGDARVVEELGEGEDVVQLDEEGGELAVGDLCVVRG